MVVVPPQNQRKITVNDFQHPLIYLEFNKDVVAANLFASYLRVILYRNKERGNDDRIRYYRLLRELKLMKDDGVISEQEYSKEIMLVNQQFSFLKNIEQVRTLRLQQEEQDKKRVDAELQRKLEEKRKLEELQALRNSR